MYSRGILLGSRRILLVTTLALLSASATTATPTSAATAGTPCERTIKPPPPKCANFDCSDPMFTVFHPPRGSYASGHCAELAIPFAVYDANLSLLFGSASLAALGTITAGSGYHPVATDDGHGFAALAVVDYHDTNAGPYREIAIGFPVNKNRVTVSTQNPYAFLSEFFNPENKVWMHKLILSELMPIDYGREILGYDKNPAPQNITVRTTAQDTTFAATDPLGNPILSGRVAVDTDPKGQAQALSQAVAAPHGGNWLERFLTGGGLAQLNIVNRDVLRRSDELMQSYSLVRPKSPLVLGLVGPESALTVEPSSDFGGEVSRIDFRPLVSARMSVRTHIDTGFAP